MQHKPAENIVGSEEVPEQVPAAVPTPESGVVDLAKLAKIQQKIQRDVFLFRLLLFPFAFFGLFIGNLAYKAKTGDKLDFGLLLLMYIVFCLTSLVCGVCFGCMYGGVLGLISPPTSSPPTLEQQGRGQAETFTECAKLIGLLGSFLGVFFAKLIYESISDEDVEYSDLCIPLFVAGAVATILFICGACFFVPVVISRAEKSIRAAATDSLASQEEV